MRRASLLLVSAFFLFPSTVSAEMLVVRANGEVVWNVLAEEDSTDADSPKSNLEVKEVNETPTLANADISLTKDNGKVNLTVESKSGKREIELNKMPDSIVKIEERPEVQTITIGVSDDKFSLRQNGVVALTTYPLSINSKSAHLMISTDSGEKYLSVFPYQVMQTLLRAKVINTSVKDTKLNLTEKEGKLAYEVTGQRVIRILNIFNYSVPVTSIVSAYNGEIMAVDQPVWLKMLGFLFE